MKEAKLSVTAGVAILGLMLGGIALAESPYQSSADFSKYAEKLRESAIAHLEPQVIVPTFSRPLSFGSSTYPWKTGIYTTIFWVGENASLRNPVHNRSSSWDLNWETSYGGFDDPEKEHRRAKYFPPNFVPRQNPFYFALPYNDVTHGSTKPEASHVIPWFKNAFVREGQSVCRDRWIAIRNPRNNKLCYAQWSDCGPFRTDHWQYVFGTDFPKPNLNHGAGLDVSPAVRDFLDLAPIDITDWRFVEFREVPKGPWAEYGDNNTFVQQARGSVERVASAAAAGATAPARSPAAAEPRVIFK